MEQDKEFMQKVLKLFYENGAKTTTMDDIAKAFSMSKKTLYQQYENKEQLLEMALDFQRAFFLEEFKQVESSNLCPIEKLFCRKRKMEDLMEDQHSIFVRQLAKYYPNIKHRHMVNVERDVVSVLVSNVEKGRADGVFREDFDAHQYARNLILLIFSYDDSPIIDTDKENRAEYFFDAITFYLNAIVTEKGREKLNYILSNKSKFINEKENF